ncbi:MAG: adaptor protein MecA [Acutalibacteraceae bacterium]
MTVLKIGQKKLKITLTDSEVLSFFGAYERLNAATSETRLTVGLLLRESLSEYETELDGDLLVEIRARENAGCVITVSSADSSKRKSVSTVRTLEFADSSSLISGAVRLYRVRPRIRSSLYKMTGTYRLLISQRTDCDLFFMNEFCLRQSDSPIEAEYTKEHGRLITENNAVEKIGRAFFGST